MGRIKSKYVIKGLKEFEDKGFLKSSTTLLYHLRKIDTFKIFKPGIIALSGRKGSVKYSCIDILGDRLVYYYDYEKKEKFADFLAKKFLAKNPNPDRGIRKAFSQLLHTNGLHWYGCTCRIKDEKNSDKNSDNDPEHGHDAKN